jgi:hypothetical protein
VYGEAVIVTNNSSWRFALCAWHHVQTKWLQAGHFLLLGTHGGEVTEEGYFAWY